MDKRSLSLVPLFTLFLAMGCATKPAPLTPSPAPTPAPTFLQLTGNWEMTAVPLSGTTTLPGPVHSFTGALQSTNGIVTGTLRAFSVSSNPLAPCVPLRQDLAATGTLDTQGNLTLTAPIAGGTATLAVTLTSTLHSSVAGTYRVDGGSCAMPSSSMLFAQLAPLTGTYTGTLTSPVVPGLTPSTPGSVIATAMLTQSSAPNTDGLFPLSGTVNITGSCAKSFSFSDGLVAGSLINLFYTPANPLVLEDVLHGFFTPTATTILGDLSLAGPGCSYLVFAGTLTHQ